MSERDKFLTQAMGLCWHEKHIPYDGKKKIKFDTWQGFGLLWEWAQKQEWFFNFIEGNTYYASAQELSRSKDCIINPSRFSDALYEYLKNTRH